MRTKPNDSGFFWKGYVIGIPAFCSVFIMLIPTACAEHLASVGCLQIFCSVLHLLHSMHVPVVNASASG